MSEVAEVINNEVAQVETATTENTQAPGISLEQKEYANNLAIALDQELPYDLTEKPNIEVAATEVVATEQSTVQAQGNNFDANAFVKENFGTDSLEEAKAQWLALQELKANPPKPVFDSEQIKQAYSILDKQERLGALLEAEVTAANAPQIIKESFKEKYKGLTQEQIDYKFNKSYGLPKEPVQNIVEDDEEFEQRIVEYKEKCKDIEMDMIIEANVIKPELAKIKEELKFPEIESQGLQNDEDYEAYKASSAAVSKQATEVIIPAINSLKMQDVNFAFKVDDANNQMQFDLSLTPTAEDFEKARQDSLSFDNFVANICYDEKGNFNSKALMELVLLHNNKDKYIQSVARQAVNEERKRVVAKETGNSNLLNRDFNVNTDKTEFQKQMDLALS